jgi:hypothetical protein
LPSSPGDLAFELARAPPGVSGVSADRFLLFLPADDVGERLGVSGEVDVAEHLRALLELHLFRALEEYHDHVERDRPTEEERVASFLQGLDVRQQIGEPVLCGAVDDDARRPLRVVLSQEDHALAESGIDDAVGRHQKHAGPELLLLITGTSSRLPPRRLGRDEPEQRREDRRPDDQSGRPRKHHDPPIYTETPGRRSGVGAGRGRL